LNQFIIISITDEGGAWNEISLTNAAVCGTRRSNSWADDSYVNPKFRIKNQSLQPFQMCPAKLRIPPRLQTPEKNWKHNPD
jgi:hypothetical protein